jgi:hypothetical protein
MDNHNKKPIVIDDDDDDEDIQCLGSRKLSISHAHTRTSLRLFFLPLQTFQTQQFFARIVNIYKPTNMSQAT